MLETRLNVDVNVERASPVWCAMLRVDFPAAAVAYSFERVQGDSSWFAA